MAVLKRGEARIYYETYGEGAGEWVTLVNGSSRSSSDFRAFARVLVENGYRVLTPDNRGAGRTESWPEFTLADIAEDIAAIWDELGVDRSHLLGISLGGMISQTLAGAYPDRVASLSLVSTSPTARYLHPGNQLDSATPEDVEREMTKYFSPGFIARNQLLYKSMLKETGKAYNDPVSRERARGQRRATQGFDFVGRLGELTMPALVVHGDADEVIEIAAVDAFRQGLPHAQVAIFEGAGHLLLVEAPKRLYETVVAFLKAAR